MTEPSCNNVVNKFSFVQWEDDILLPKLQLLFKNKQTKLGPEESVRLVLASGDLDAQRMS